MHGGCIHFQSAVTCLFSNGPWKSAWRLYTLHFQSAVTYLTENVQFKMVSIRLEKPICALAPSLRSLPPPPPPRPNGAFETVCSSDLQWPSLVLSRKIVERFQHPRLSPPGDRWCAVLGFVPAGSISSSSPPLPPLLWWLLPPSNWVSEKKSKDLLPPPPPPPPPPTHTHTHTPIPKIYKVSGFKVLYRGLRA